MHEIRKAPYLQASLHSSRLFQPFAQIWPRGGEVCICPSKLVVVTVSWGSDGFATGGCKPLSKRFMHPNLASHWEKKNMQKK